MACRTGGVNPLKTSRTGQSGASIETEDNGCQRKKKIMTRSEWINVPK